MCIRDRPQSDRAVERYGAGQTVVFASDRYRRNRYRQCIDPVSYTHLGLIKGFKGKNGKAFDASLVLDEQFSVAFSFPEKKGKPKK